MKAVHEIFSQLKNHWKTVIFVYGIQLLYGLGVGIVSYGALEGALGDSMALDQLAKGFDRTVFTDAMNIDENLFGATTQTGIVLLIAYLIASIFIQGGWIANIKEGKYSVRQLLISGRRFFLPFAGIAMISLLLIILFGGLVGYGFSSIVGDPLVTFTSEKPYVFWIMALVVVFVLWAIIVWSWSVASRLHYIDHPSFWKSIRLGFKSLRTKWWNFLVLGLILVVIHVVLMIVYYTLMQDRGAASWAVVVLGILIQQFFAFLRVTIRGGAYIAAHHITKGQ